MDAKRCDGCAKEFSADEVVELGGRTLCGACKQSAVMDAKSGVATDTGGLCPPDKAEEIAVRIKQLNLMSFAFALPGLGLQFLPILLVQLESPEEYASLIGIALMLRLLAPVLLIVGLGIYARMRNRSWAWGLFGLLSCIGLLVLLFLGKVCRFCGTKSGYSVKSCPKCTAPLG